jgi:hypothetical protein
VLAVRQDALALAVLGALGGFAAPVLVSTGAGNHVVLFTFYAVLDAGIFAIAWLRPWRALNLLGSVVPVIDLRVKFGLTPIVPTVDTVVVVAEVEVDGEVTLVGAMVDGVLEVFEVGADALEPPPRMGTRLATEFIESMVRHEDEFFIVLDIDRVLSVDEVIALRDSVAAAGKGGARKDA